MMFAAIIGMPWLAVAGYLLSYLWPDIVFASAELEDPWSATILFGLAVLWPLSIILLIYAVARDIWKAKRC